MHWSYVVNGLGSIRGGGTVALHNTHQWDVLPFGGAPRLCDCGAIRTSRGAQLRGRAGHGIVAPNSLIR
jgi:hypothetical protein